MLFITNKLPNFVGEGSLTLTPADPRKVVEALKSGFISLVEDETTAEVISAFLSTKIPVNTLNVLPKLGEDTVIVVNILGDPLPKGAKTLLPTTSIGFSVVESKKPAIDMKQIKRGIAGWLLKDL